MTLKLYNTLSQHLDDFIPQDAGGKVTLYTCGPTVYNYLTVGNWAAYIYWDTLVRVLLANGYLPERVMNITDVGHLVSDEDDGEDKLQKGAKREGKTAWEIAEFYAEDFMKGMEKLGLLLPEHVIKATDYLPQQLDLIRTLKAKGYTYQISDGIYFDTSKFPTYADFARLDLDALKAGARVTLNPEKRHQSDFAVWKFSPTDEKRDMEWETPGDLLDASLAADGATTGPVPNVSKRDDEIKVMGFPGWHLECSAMALSVLGNTLDIHTGGIDHIPVHHTNEIAQSESATGKRFANYWLHCSHLKVDGTKISKSLGNGYTLNDLEAKGYSPLDYRMFVLQGQFTGEGNFTFENLEAAKNRRGHWRAIAALTYQINDTLKPVDNDANVPSAAASAALIEALNDNLNTPAALSIVDDTFSAIENTLPTALNKHNLDELLTTIDDTLGLQLRDSTPDISDDQKQQILERSNARHEKDWPTSDKIRNSLQKQGIALNDTARGTTWYYEK